MNWHYSAHLLRINDWVLSHSNSGIFVIDQAGAGITYSGKAKILRSGRRNQSAVSIGSVACRKDPVASGAVDFQGKEILQAVATEYSEDWQTWSSTLVPQCQCEDDDFIKDFLDMLNYVNQNYGDPFNGISSLNIDPFLIAHPDFAIFVNSHFPTRGNCPPGSPIRFSSIIQGNQFVINLGDPNSFGQCSCLYTFNIPLSIVGILPNLTKYCQPALPVYTPTYQMLIVSMSLTL